MYGSNDDNFLKVHRKDSLALTPGHLPVHVVIGKDGLVSPTFTVTGGGTPEYAKESLDEEAGVLLRGRACEMNEGDTAEDARMATAVSRAIWISFLVNIALFALKLWVYTLSKSMSVLASCLDSGLDLIVQIVLVKTDAVMAQADKSKYPLGLNRLEPISIIMSAIVMGIASLYLIVESAEVLYTGWALHNLPDLDFSVLNFIIVGTIVVVKFLLYAYCSYVASVSPTVEALAVDHFNDVVSNIGVGFAAALAFYYKPAWSADSIFSVLISLYIIWNWWIIAEGKIDELVGRAASNEFFEEITTLVRGFHGKMELDCVRAYSFGSKYLVEVEVVLPSGMTVKESHDLSLALQKKIERRKDVERTFVHVDYTSRDVDEHANEEGNPPVIVG